MTFKSIPNLMCDKCGQKTMNRVAVFDKLLRWKSGKKENIIGYIGKNCVCGNKEIADEKEIEYINQTLNFERKII